MINGTEDRNDLCIRLPITQAARTQAQVFADQHPEKAEQVYQNTLAVWVVNDYLQLQGYATELTAGDSWNAATRLCGDVADLVITGLGRIECRPVRSLELSCPIPPEVWHNRIGYVVVLLDASFREATLLGFVPTFDPEDPLEELPPASLQSMDEFIDYLYRLEVGQPVIQGDSPEAEQVQQMWEPQALPLIVAQLERIWQTEKPSKWGVKGEKVLSGRVLVGGATREADIQSDRIQLQGVARRLLEKLAEVWGENG